MRAIQGTAETEMSTIIPAAMGSQDLHVLPELQLLKLVIAVRWQRPNTIPGSVVANVIRGALGLTLRKLVCPPELFHEPCPPCPLYASCAYGQVFAPAPPVDAPQLSRQADLPRPFVIEPPGLHPETPVTPEGMTFGLTLFGTAIARLPFLLTTLARLGEEGMGRDRVPFIIERATAQHPAGDEVLFTSADSQMRMPKKTLTCEDLFAIPRPLVRADSPSLASERVRQRFGLTGEPPSHPGRPHVRLRFLTPTVLKTGSGLDGSGGRVAAKEVRNRPPFGVIIRRLRDRLSALSAFFGDPWETDFVELGRQADAVALVLDRTRWVDRRRQSTRTGQSHTLSGFVGQATYEFRSPEHLATLWPLLTLAPHLHVGKYAPWGHGKVEAEMVEGGSS